MKRILLAFVRHFEPGLFMSSSKGRHRRSNPQASLPRGGSCIPPALLLSYSVHELKTGAYPRPRGWGMGEVGAWLCMDGATKNLSYSLRFSRDVVPIFMLCWTKKHLR